MSAGRWKAECRTYILQIILFAAPTGAISAAHKSLSCWKKNEMQIANEITCTSTWEERRPKNAKAKIKIIKQSTAQTEAAEYLDGKSPPHLTISPLPIMMTHIKSLQHSDRH